MLGRNLESAEGTVVATEVAVQTAAGYEDRLRYAVDVHPSTGPAFRVTLEEPKFIRGGFAQPSVGDVLGVLYDPKKKTAKFDTSDPRINASTQQGADKATFEAAATASPGTAPPPRSDQMQVLTGVDTAQLANAPSLSKAAGTEAHKTEDPSARLAKLDDLKAKGLVSDAEYSAQREKIIDSV